MDEQRCKERVAALSVASNTLLVVVKVIVGVVIGSVSIVSEAIHSAVDLLASVIALFSVKTSGIPADQEHPFGHGKIENISAAVEALLIFAAAAGIVYAAVKKLVEREPIEAVGWGVVVMIASAVANSIVSSLLFKVSRETDSIALEADAWHLRTDVYTSMGVMAALAIIWVGENFLPGVDLTWIDPVAAIGVALLIFKTAADLTSRATKDLLDVRLPPSEVDWIRRSITDHDQAILGFHDLRTRKAGHFRFVEFHLKVNPAMTVAAAHTVAKNLAEKIKARYPYTTVTSHIEPCDGNCTEKCRAGCIQPRQEKEKDL